MTQTNLRLDEETFRDKTKAGGGLSKTVGKGSIMRLKRNESIELGTPAAIEPEAKLFALAALVDLAEKAFHDAVACRNEAQIAYLREPSIITHVAFEGAKTAEAVALEILDAEVRWLASTRATTVSGLKLKASYASTVGKLADSIVAVLEPPAGIAGLDDIAVMGQPIQHGGGHLGVAEDLRPIGEGEVGGDQQRRVLIELADQMEQQLAAGLAERQIAEFVDDDEIVAQQLLGQAATATGRLFLFELVDQIDQVEEASSRAGADDGRGHGDAEMGFAGAGAADEDGVALGVEERAGGEFAHLPFIDRRVGKDELVDVLEDRELGAANTITDRSGLTVRLLGPEQAGDERIYLVAPRQALAGDLVKAGAHAVELEFAHGVENLVPFHQATFS
jgi:hypothetical protein